MKHAIFMGLFFLLTGVGEARECSWSEDSTAFTIMGAKSSSGAIALVERRDQEDLLHLFKPSEQTPCRSLCDFRSSRILMLNFSADSNWLLVEVDSHGRGSHTLLVDITHGAVRELVSDQVQIRNGVFLSRDTVLGVPVQEEDMYEPRGFLVYKVLSGDVETVLGSYVADSILAQGRDSHLLRVMKPKGDLLQPCVLIWNVKDDVQVEICQPLL